MKRRRKIVVYTAISADGFVARPRGDVAWLERDPPKGNYGMLKFFETIDTIVKDSEPEGVGIEMDMISAVSDSGFNTYIFSPQRNEILEPGAEWASGPIKTFAQRLRALPGKDVWLIGSSVVSAFLDEGEIDEFHMLVVPIFIGQGIGVPLVQARQWPIRLKLLSSESFRDGVVYLKYGVVSKIVRSECDQKNANL